MLSKIASAATSITLSRKRLEAQGFVVGTTFLAWVARGFLYVDDERDMSPPIMAMFTAVR